MSLGVAWDFYPTHIASMSRIDRVWSYRRVPLHSAEASDARLGSTVSERLDMLRALSLSAWAATGRPLPTYSRSEIPFRRLKLSDVRDDDQE